MSDRWNSLLASLTSDTLIRPHSSAAIILYSMSLSSVKIHLYTTNASQGVRVESDKIFVVGRFLQLAIHRVWVGLSGVRLTNLVKIDRPSTFSPLSSDTIVETCCTLYRALCREGEIYAIRLPSTWIVIVNSSSGRKIEAWFISTQMVNVFLLSA